MASCVDTLDPDERILCNSNHCDKFQQTSGFHRICNCVDWQGKTVSPCDPKDNLYPVQTGQCIDKNGNYQPLSNNDCYGKGWFWQTCNCCCSCFAATTPVAVPDGVRAMGDIAIGDQVLAAARTAKGWSWTPQEVQFSSGSPRNATGTGSLMFYIEYGAGESLVASPNQLFLMAGSSKLKRAEQLAPGVDHLVDRNGEAVPIARIHSGMYVGAIHHIATDVPTYEQFTGSIDNHLIIANGIISGDYVLQLYQDTEKMKQNLLLGEEHPVAGTVAYQAKHAAATHSAFGALAAANAAPIAHPQFAANVASTSIIPPGAVALFTPEQEAQLLDPDIPKRPLSDATNQRMTTYYSQVLSPFCPGIRFYVDWTSLRANVFAFTEYGQKTVVVGGEFLRLGALYDSAMAVALAFGAAALMHESDGPQTVGRSLYDGIAGVASAAMKGGNAWNDKMIAGTSQLGGVIRALIAKQGQNGDSGALLCLLDVMNAAVSGDELPQCAGGPTPDGLKLLSASYDVEFTQMTVTFNEAVSPYTANNPKNYRIVPYVEVAAALVDPKRPTVVTLKVDLGRGGYTLKVVNVRATDGSTLDPTGSMLPVNGGDTAR
jgi:hypothetical protein